MMLQQQSLKNVMTLFVLALLLGVGFSFLGGSSHAHAATLGARADVATPHDCTTKEVSVGFWGAAEAHWTKCINASSTTVNGWVKDTDADGQCGQVYAIFSNGKTYSMNACGNGTVKYFNWSEPTVGASVYLRTIG
jgi:hypothetical protein